MENEKKYVPRQDAKLLETKVVEKMFGYDEKQRIGIGLLSDPKEDWRDWLRHIASEAGVDAKVHLDWVEAHFSMSDLGPSQNAIAELARDWSHDGAPIELQIKLASESNAALAEGAARWKRFAQTILAASLRRMEERGDTAEEEMDVLVRALRPLRGRLRTKAGELMLAARARMAQRPDQQDGYYKTRGALADSLAGSKDELSQRRRCYLYWEILTELQSMGTQHVSSGTWAGIVNTDANNLAVSLDDLRLHRESAEFMKLAVVAGSAARQLGEGVPVNESAKVGLAPLFGDAATPEWAALLDDMGNVPTTWKFAYDNASDIDVLLVEMGAAVGRAGLETLEDEPRKVVSALFNAGVTVSRGVKSGGSWGQPVECRIALNGAGLLWAMVCASKGGEAVDYLVAMTENEGGNCAVNLMGALTEFSRVATNEPLSRFVDALYGIRQAIPGENFARIEGLLGKLKVTPSHVTVDPMPALIELLRTCLPPGPWQAAWDAFAQSPSPVTLGALLAQTGEQSHLVGFNDALSRLAGLLATFEHQASQWPDAFMGAPIKEWIPEWHADIEVEWRAMLNGPTFPDRLAATANDLIHG